MRDEQTIELKMILDDEAKTLHIILNASYHDNGTMHRLIVVKVVHYAYAIYASRLLMIVYAWKDV